MPNIDLGSVVGPQGPTGAQGATGPQGPQGLPAKVNGVEPDESGEITLNAGDISGSLRYDASQSLTEEEKTTARNNIGSASQVALAKKPDALQATTNIHVAKTGSDTTGDGSEENPYLTIQKAVDSLPKLMLMPASIHIHAGVYDEYVEVKGISGAGEFQLIGDDGDGTQVKIIRIKNCNCRVVVKNIELTGTDGSSYNWSMQAYGSWELELSHVTCVNSVTSANVGALFFIRTSAVFLNNCTISNKPVAIDIVGSTVYMNSTVTGENNTVGIRCGSAWGSFGGFMQKGGATIAGEEQKGYGGQIW